MEASEWTAVETSIDKAMDAKRTFTLDECRQMEDLLRRAASIPTLNERAQAVAKRAVKCMPPDHRALCGHDYIGVVFQRGHDNHCAYLSWHTATCNEPPLSSSSNVSATPIIMPPPPISSVLPPESVPTTTTPQVPSAIETKQVTRTLWWIAPSEFGIPISQMLDLRGTPPPPAVTNVQDVEKDASSYKLPARRYRMTEINHKHKFDLKLQPLKNSNVQYQGACQSNMMMHLRRNMLFALAELKGQVYEPHDSRLISLQYLLSSSSEKKSSSSSVRDIILTAPNVAPPFHVSTPTILLNHHTPGGGYWVLFRITNYRLTDAHQYIFPPGAPHIVESRLHMALLPPEALSTTESTFMTTTVDVATPVPEKAHESVAKGWEDTRLVYEPRSKRVFGVSTTWSRVGNTEGGHMGVLEFNTGDMQTVKGGVVLRHDTGSNSDENQEDEEEEEQDDRDKGHRRIESSLQLRDALQKNWAPFVWRGGLYFVYSFHPLTVLQADVASGLCRLVALDANMRLNDWRGSSPLVRIPLPWIRRLPEYPKSNNNISPSPPTALQDLTEDQVWFVAVVHVTRAASHTRPDKPRVNHRVPWIHHQFVILQLQAAHVHAQFRPLSLRALYASPPFHFGAVHGIEYCCGLAPSSSTDFSRLVASYSLRDEEAHVVSFDTQDLWSRLEPITLPPFLKDVL